MSDIRYGKAIVLEKIPSCNFCGSVRNIKFRGRFYTVFGRMFAVAGRSVPYEKACGEKQYAFSDWNELRDMYSLA